MKIELAQWIKNNNLKNIIALYLVVVVNKIIIVVYSMTLTLVPTTGCLDYRTDRMIIKPLIKYTTR